MPKHILCPFCRKLFSIELEDKEFVNREEVTYFDSYRPANGANPGFNYASGFPSQIRREEVRYKYTYKCKHCGYEWSEIKSEKG